MWKFPKYEVGQDIPWDKLEKEFEWFRDMKDVPQDPEWHAEGNVFIHTKMVAEALVSHPDFQLLTEQDKHIMFAVAMFHDIEKRSTTQEEELSEMVDGKLVNKMRITARNHAKKGEKTVRKILYTEIETPFEIREQICMLVRHHGAPLWVRDKEDQAKSVVELSLKLNTRMVALFAKADILGRIADDDKEMLERIEWFEILCDINGCDGVEKEFVSQLGRRYYFQKEDGWAGYEPFDEKNFTAYVMCALPGSGKDTYIENNLSHLPMVSLDDIRRKNKVKRGDSKKEGQAIQEAKESAKVNLRAKQDFVWNATNITKEMRGKVIRDFEDYGAKVEVIYVEVPFKELIKQNHNRKHKVPESAIKDMIGSLEIPDVTECYNVKYIIKD